jgi:alkanesulfonate monooxygenase
VESGIYFDPEKLHVLEHRGEWFQVRGPLNVARPLQGWPVIVQAGASEAGRQIAAETAELVFSASNTLEDGRALYADIKRRAAAYGRDPVHIKILPGVFVVVGDSLAEARAIKTRLDGLVHPESGISTLSVLLGTDARKFDLDGPLPPLPESNASKSSRDKLIGMAQSSELTVRELAQVVGGSFGVLEMVGTPMMVADQMEEWLMTDGCDGFNVMFPYLPGGLDAFVERVVPELQRRGLFRREYAGSTLRENLGLPRPQNRFFAQA